LSCYFYDNAYNHSSLIVDEKIADGYQRDYIFIASLNVNYQIPNQFLIEHVIDISWLFFLL